MENVAAAVEHDLGDAGLDGPLCHVVAHLLGNLLAGSGPVEILLNAGRGDQGLDADVVDDLCLDVLIGAKYF